MLLPSANNGAQALVPPHGHRKLAIFVPALDQSACLVGFRPRPRPISKSQPRITASKPTHSPAVIKYEGRLITLRRSKTRHSLCASQSRATQGFSQCHLPGVPRVPDRISSARNGVPSRATGVKSKRGTPEHARRSARSMPNRGSKKASIPGSPRLQGTP
jgi:hypothetical protein